jgi:hypothetical protein
MGMFAGTAIVPYRYRSSFANQGKQTFFFRFSLQKTNGSLSFPFSVCSQYVFR